MAFTFQVIRGSTTYTLSGDGQPIKLVSVDDLGGASVRNIEQSGPYQDGSTHLDYRLEPSTFTLRFNVIGATATALDGHRDTLNTIFKPVRGVPITLKITRDDGTVRQIDTQRTGRLAIALEAMNRPGNLHRAVVQLRATDPTWYDPDDDDASFIAPGQWWLAYGAIGTAVVIEHADAPGTGQLWTNSGSVAQGDPWTVFIRAGFPVGGDAQQYLFESAQSDRGVNWSVFPTALTGGTAQLRSVNSRPSNTTVFDVTAGLAPGTSNYFLMSSGTTLEMIRDGVQIGTIAAVGGTVMALPGTTQGTARWRSESTGGGNFFVGTVPYAAAYSGTLSAAQQGSLIAAAVAGSAFSNTIVYSGDVDSYPVIRITGPFANPVLTNTTTGDVLDFTGGTVGSADVWTIDTRYGRKSALNLAGSSVANYLSTDSDLATFRLVPDPIAAGGTNQVTLGGSAQGTAAAASMSWYMRYLGY